MGAMSGGWETGERAPLRWRLVAGTAAVVVLVVVVVVTRRGGGLTVDTSENALEVQPPQVDVVVEPPTFAGGRWFCPNNLPVRAYDGGRAFPRQHPNPPALDVRPANCFRDLAVADAAGYRLAPPPADVVVVAGIYLEPVPDLQTQTCENVATRLALAVPCPTLLPHPSAITRCATNSCDFSHGFVLEQRGFAVPQEWCSTCDAHLVITAARRTDRVSGLFNSCVGVAPAFQRLPGRPGAFVEQCPPGPPWIPDNGGYPHERHTVVRWRHGDTAFAVSVEGHDKAQRDVAVKVAEQVVLVAPAAVRGP